MRYISDLSHFSRPPLGLKAVLSPGLSLKSGVLRHRFRYYPHCNRVYFSGFCIPICIPKCIPNIKFHLHRPEIARFYALFRDKQWRLRRNMKFAPIRRHWYLRDKRVVMLAHFGRQYYTFGASSGMSVIWDTKKAAILPPRMILELYRIILFDFSVRSVVHVVTLCFSILLLCISYLSILHFSFFPP